MIKNSDVDSDEDLDESQDFIEGEDIENEQNELHEMRSDSVFDVIKKDGVIALYSSPNSLELFYLCKVKEFGIAQENLIDTFNHIIPKGSKFIKCQYFEKYEEKRGGVMYKILPETVLVLPTQVLNPVVELDEDGSLSMENYLWLSDRI